MIKDKEIIIHVGLHKTGSTFLQKKVFPNLKTFHLIAPQETRNNIAFNKLMYADDCFYNKIRVENEINKISKKKILITDESFTGQPINMYCNNKSTIAKRLAGLFPDAKIILFIRGQKDMIFSLYSQYLVQNNGVKFLFEFFKHPRYSDSLKIYPNYKNNPIREFGHYSIPGFSHFDCFLHYETINLYKTLFKEVYVFLYEDFLFSPKDTLAKIESIFQESLNIPSIDFTNKINPSLNYKDFQKRRFYNKSKFILRKKIVSDFLFFFYKIVRLKKNIGQKELLILDRIIADYYTPNNQKILKEFPEINIAKYPEFYPFKEK
jgi:hypothetical protein